MSFHIDTFSRWGQGPGLHALLMTLFYIVFLAFLLVFI